MARVLYPLKISYANGAIDVADTYNHKIKFVDPRKGVIQLLGGTE